MRISGDGKVTWENASASSKYLLEMRVAGDNYPRFRIRADGRIEWGSGAAAPDAVIYRSTANALRILDTVVMDGQATTYINQSSGVVVVGVKQSGDSNYRLALWSNTYIQAGPGNASLDCTLYRRAPNTWNTPHRLEVGTLGVGNSAAGSTLGNVVKKIEVFDDAGNSLGFLAVYDSIS